MKRSFRLLSLAGAVSVLLTGCLMNGQVKVRKDDFTKKTVATVDFYRIGSSESMLSGGGYADFSFAREFDDKTESASLTINVKVSSMAKDLEEKCFLRVDDRTSEFKIADRNSTVVTTVKKTTTTTYAPDPNGAVDFTKGQKRTDIDTDRHKEYTGKITLTDDFKKSVLAGKGLVIRLYGGTDPLTFTFPPEYFASLVSFYNATGNEK